jgi:hypothetical protein
MYTDANQHQSISNWPLRIRKLAKILATNVPTDETIVDEATTPTSEIVETNHEQVDKEEIQSEVEPPNVPPPLYFSLRSRQIPKIVALLTVIALCLVSTNDTKISIKPELLIVDLNSPAQLKCTIDIVGDDTIEWHHQLMGSGFIYEDDSGLTGITSSYSTSRGRLTRKLHMYSQSQRPHSCINYVNSLTYNLAKRMLLQT